MSFLNVSFCEITRNASTYHVDNRTIQFSFFMMPLVQAIMHQMKQHVLYAEDFMLTFLQERRTCCDLDDYKDLAKHMHTPIIYAYIICGGVILSLMGIIYVCCMCSCTKKTINAIKHQCCFCVEVLFFAVFVICLVVGAVGLNQITSQIQYGLTIFPRIAEHFVYDLRNHLNLFSNQVHLLGQIFKNFTEHIFNIASAIPQNVSMVISNELNPNLNNAILNFNRIMDETRDLIDKSGLVIENGAVEHMVTILARDLVAKLEPIYENLRDLQKHVIMNDNISGQYKERLGKTLAVFQNELTFTNSYQFPDWLIVYRNMTQVVQKLMPQIHNSLYFVDEFTRNFQNSTFSELDRLISSSRNLQAQAKEIEKNVPEVLSVLFPEQIQYSILDVVDRIDRFIFNLELSSKTNGFVNFTNVLTWLIYLPTFYAFSIFACLILASVFAMREMQKISADASWQPPPVKPFWTMVFFRIAMCISVSFLWVILIITGVFYVIHLPLSVFCQSLKDETIFTQFLDNPSVWENNTWIDFQLNGYFPQHKNLKLREVLSDCFQNKSVYDSLGLDEYWSKSKSLDVKQMYVNTTVLHTMATKTIQDLHMPEAQIMDEVISKIVDSETILNLDFVPLITKEAERLSNSSIPQEIQTIIHLLPRSPVYDFVQKRLMLLESNINEIKLNVTQFLLGNISKLVKFKQCLQTTKKKLDAIKLKQLNFSKTMESAGIFKVQKFIDATSNDVSLLINQTTRYLEKSIKNDFENCYFVPFLFDKATWALCSYGLILITSAWISLGLTGTSIAICTVLSCRLSGYVRGAHIYYWQWRQRLDAQRYASQRQRLRNDTLLFDRSGNFMGSSLALKAKMKTSQDDIN